MSSFAEMLKEDEFARQSNGYDGMVNNTNTATNGRKRARVRLNNIRFAFYVL